MMQPMRLLAMVAGAAVTLTACNGATGPSDNGTYEPLPADNVMVGVEHHMTVAGVRNAKLVADTSLMFNDSSMVQLRGVNLELYDAQGRLRATLTSERGALDQRTNRMIARGTVVLKVSGAQPRTVWTEELHYDPDAKRVWSDVATRMQEAGGVDISGTGFDADDQFTNVNVRGGAGSRARGIRIPIGGG